MYSQVTDIGKQVTIVRKNENQIYVIEWLYKTIKRASTICKSSLKYRVENRILK